MNHRIDKVSTPAGAVKYELRVWSKGRAGKQIKRRFNTRALASNFLERLRKETASAAPGALGRTFGEEYSYWRKHAAQDFAPGWLVNIDGYWRQLESLIDSRQIDKFSPEFLKEVESGLREKGNAQKTINNKMGFILAVINFSVEMRRIPHSPVAGYTLAKSPEPDIEFWEREEALSYFAFLENECEQGRCERWRYSACLATVNTGVRAGELWALRPYCIKRSKSLIRVSEQFNRVSKEFATLKGKEARSVPLNAQLLAELDGACAGLKDADLIFSIDSKPIDHDVFHDWFDSSVKAWGGRRITFHGLRHTAATLMLEAGVNIKTLQEIMGHKDIKTTMKYVHLLSANVADAARIFGLAPKSTTALRLA